MVATAAALVPAGVSRRDSSSAGWLAAIGAALLGVYFLHRSLDFGRARTDRAARRVLRASLIYLPCVFALLLIDALVLT